MERDIFEFKINSEIFHFSQDKDPADGDLLIASANLLDPNFKRSVIFLCDHTEKGSFGLVLNHLLPMKLSDVMRDIGGWNAPLYQGGPVQTNTLHLVHSDPALDIGSKEICPGIYWGGDFNRACELIREGTAQPDTFRFFAGYSGWAGGQLESEIKSRSWYITPATAGVVFTSNTESLWTNVLQSLGPHFKMLLDYPEDPTLN